MRTVVLDLETQRLFDEVEEGRHDKLGVSVVGIYDSQTGLNAFFEQDLPNLWPIIHAADLIVGFNIKKFDWPVLSAYYSGDLNLLPTLDLLEVVKDTLGFRVKLDDLAKATLGKGKIGDGLDAYRYWREGNLESLKEYCLQDVIITRDLFYHALEKKFLKYPDLTGVVEFKVDLERWMPKKTGSFKQQIGFDI